MALTYKKIIKLLKKDSYKKFFKFFFYFLFLKTNFLCQI